MFGIHDFSTFLLSGLLLNLTPGPDTLYVLGRSMSQGRRGGMASALGIAAGSLVHTLAATLGLSALLSTSAAAFMLVRLAGAAYLCYLGARLLFGPGSSSGTDATMPRVVLTGTGFLAACRQGLLTNVLNPKVALFFLAFLPQFVTPGSPDRFSAFLTLGLCFVATGTLWCLALAWGAAPIGERLRSHPGQDRLLHRATGGLFFLLGLRLATTR